MFALPVRRQLRYYKEEVSVIILYIIHEHTFVYAACMKQLQYSGVARRQRQKKNISLVLLRWFSERLYYKAQSVLLPSRNIVVRAALAKRLVSVAGRTVVAVNPGMSRGGDAARCREK